LWPWTVSAIAVFVSSVASCSQPASDRAAPSPSASASTPKAAASTEKPAPAFEVLRLTLTSGVKAKNPIDSLEAAEAGQRVWAHVTMRNRTGAPKRISVVFHVDDEERSTTDLKVDPWWSYRTWAYVTLKPPDAGSELRVEVRGEGGTLLAEDAIPIH